MCIRDRPRSDLRRDRSHDRWRRMRTARSTEATPKRPARLASAQYGQPAQGSPVGAPGTVVPGDVVEVVDPGDVVEVVDPGDVVEVVDPGDVVVEMCIRDRVAVGSSIAEVGPRDRTDRDRQRYHECAGCRPRGVLHRAETLGRTNSVDGFSIVTSTFSRAVSYTHLDVYKRQFQASASVTSAPEPLLSYPTAVHTVAALQDTAVK